MKRLKVVWAAVASQDVAILAEHLFEELADEAAVRAMDALEAAARSLSTLSRRGRRIPELSRGEAELRELLVGTFRLMYRVDRHPILVFGVVDARRDVKEWLSRRARKLH